MICKVIEVDFGIFIFGSKFCFVIFFILVEIIFIFLFLFYYIIVVVVFVIDWFYYDFIYIEWYMLIFFVNKDGYIILVVNNVIFFLGDKVDFIWVYGSGDDNVYYMNSVVFLDKLM